MPTGTAPSHWKFLRTASLLLLLLAASSVLALGPGYTVQTVAFPDHREASETVAELRQLGFDAYTEFTMHEGRQFSRVRIGCFTDRNSADLLARSLRGAITRQAVVQPINPDAAVAFCSRNEVGFVKPVSWAVQWQADEQIMFRVELGGHTGYVHLVDGRWQLLHEPLAAPANSRPGSGPHQQVERHGVPLVIRNFGGAELVVCSGRLLWQDAKTAIVERVNTVIACSVEENYQRYLP